MLMSLLDMPLPFFIDDTLIYMPLMPLF